MPGKGRFVVLASALGALAALTGAHAQPASIGRALQRDNTAITMVDYYYPGYYGYRDGPYYHGDGLFGLFEIPAKVLGGVAGLLSGGPGDTYSGSYGGSYYRPPYDSPYYGGSYYRQLYVSPYYGSPYRGADYGAYYGSSYYDSPYNGRPYYLGPRYSSRGYYEAHEHYDDRRRFSDREYYSDREYSDDRYSDGRYYGDAYYYANRYNGGPYYAEPYDRSRAPHNADDDDD
jgi:hypothetical protein